jgi:CrcB protein
MQKLLLVAAGGAIGSSARYLIALLLPFGAKSIFYWGTFTVNSIGSLLIGVLWGIFESNDSHANLRIFLIVGILGGFTTFSSFAMEGINLFKEGDIRMAFVYIFATNLIGLLAAYSGYILTRQLLT